MVVGNGSRDNYRTNAFEVYQDGRAKVQTAPKDNDDVVRLKELLIEENTDIDIKTGDELFVEFITHEATIHYDNTWVQLNLMYKSSVVLSFTKIVSSLSNIIEMDSTSASP